MLDFLQDTSQLLIVLGIAALTVEIALLGMATLVLLFLGVALIASGLAMSLGWLPETLTSALWSVSIITLALSLLCWRPMKRWQSAGGQRQVNSDLNDHSFYLAETLHPGQRQAYAYSGITWQLQTEHTIPAGTRVKVVRPEVGVLWIAPVQPNT